MVLYDTCIINLCRYAKSQTEMKTLQMVKGELEKLDCLLTHDVAILRNKIEGANREYTAARQACHIEFKEA